MLTFCLHRFLCACAPVYFTGMNQPLIVWHAKLRWTCSSLAGTWRTKTSGATMTCAWVTLMTVVGMSAYLLLSPSSAPVSSCHLGEPPVLSFGSAICVIMPYGSATCVVMSLGWATCVSFLTGHKIPSYLLFFIWVSHLCCHVIWWASCVVMSLGWATCVVIWWAICVVMSFGWSISVVMSFGWSSCVVIWISHLCYVIWVSHLCYVIWVSHLCYVIWVSHLCCHGIKLLRTEQLPVFQHTWLCLLEQNRTWLAVWWLGVQDLWLQGVGLWPQVRPTGR